MVVLTESLRPKRRWLQFRLQTLLCAVAMVALICGWPHLRRHYAFWKLQQYVGVHLRALPAEERQRVDEWLALVVGEKVFDAHSDDPTVWFRENWIENWSIHTANMPGVGQIVIVIQIDLAFVSPGISYCQLRLIDRWGRPVRSLRFSAGFADPKMATFDESKHGFLCLTLETVSHGGKKTRQFYLVADDHVELLRCERLDGTMDMGNGNRFDLATKPADWSHWKRLLASDHALDQLRGLAAFWSYENQQNLGPVDEQTRRRLEQLSRSADPWIGEESAAVVRLLAERDTESMLPG